MLISSWSSQRVNENLRKTAKQTPRLAQSKNHGEPCWSLYHRYWNLPKKERRIITCQSNQTENRINCHTKYLVANNGKKRRQNHCCFMLTQMEIVNAFSKIFQRWWKKMLVAKRIIKMHKLKLYLFLYLSFLLILKSTRSYDAFAFCWRLLWTPRNSMAYIHLLLQNIKISYFSLPMETYVSTSPYSWISSNQLIISLSMSFLYHKFSH